MTTEKTSPRFKWIISLIWDIRCQYTTIRLPSLLPTALNFKQAIFHTVRASSQRHTLPNQDYIHTISEAIILNSDQHQHQKNISINNWINWKIKQQHTTFVNCCYCLREAMFQLMCLFVVYKFVLHGKQFLAKQTRGIE